jgi:hypothetical protein
MAKDPAFLFYSKDFYEGTRMMLPEERACYIDLLIYQHQNGIIPNELERVLLYCNGIGKATLEATLKAKFKPTLQGWLNDKMEIVVNNRKEYSTRQSDNGIIGQFFKKAKNKLKPKEFNKLKDFIYSEYGKDKIIATLKNNEATHEALLEGLLKHLVTANAIVNPLEGSQEDSTDLIIYRQFKHLKINNTDFEKLKERGYSQSEIDRIFDKIQNFKHNSKYTSLYLTAIDWLEREYGKKEVYVQDPNKSFDEKL